ncbi:MAG: AAA family ATPase [Anaerolineales bacterium]|jgi:hypothetical protein|nr:AAA family ATPase [Anaerolineales bacterium]
MNTSLTKQQQQVANAPLNAKMFLYGPAGSGKTTAGVARLLRLLEQQVLGGEILVLAPQRSLALPYWEALHSAEVHQGSSVSILTVGGLAQRMVDLFWPLIAAKAGFSAPDRPPRFLTLETAQYYIAQIIEPLLAEGFFDSVIMDRNRLYSQVIDNLNKAAVVGFSYQQIGKRLSAAWSGKPEQKRIYEDAQHCAALFREFCLANNLLDFSLQLETFLNYLWPDPICCEYLLRTYRHVIVDNLEEDTPAAHDLLQEWIPSFESILVIYDESAGYRRFLGADPEHGWLVSDLLPKKFNFSKSLVMSTEMQALLKVLERKLSPDSSRTQADARKERADRQPGKVGFSQVIAFGAHAYFPDMLDWTAHEVAALVQRGVPPGEIAILAPFVSDSLRFSLAQRLEVAGIESRTHRPSRSLRDEPVTRCLFALSKLAHPQWFKQNNQELQPDRFDLAYALVQAIDGLDLVRAQLLSEIVFRKRDGLVSLGSFDQIRPEMQERITYHFGEKYEQLRQWLEAYTLEPARELDHFLSRLFGEVLSQPGFGFHRQYLSGEITANLIESIQKFRWAASDSLDAAGTPLGLTYLQIIQNGVISAQYIRSWQSQPENAIWIAPAHTFLMANRPVDYQFWLDIGSRSWAERLYQPLTHPYVLSRSWPEDKLWTDADEVSTSQDALHRLTTGLLRRCRRGIYLGVSKLGEQGYEQRGPMLRTFQAVLLESQARTE